MPHASVTDKKLYQQIKYHRKNDLAQGLTGFDLCVQDIYDKFVEQEGKCYYTGITMTLPDVTRSIFDISLDRIDNSKGHTKSNTCLVSQGCNFARNAYSVQEFQEFIKAIRSV